MEHAFVIVPGDVVNDAVATVLLIFLELSIQLIESVQPHVLFAVILEVSLQPLFVQTK
jgi:hypothetical protein